MDENIGRGNGNAAIDSPKLWEREEVNVYERPQGGQTVGDQVAGRQVIDETDTIWKKAQEDFRRQNTEDERWLQIAQMWYNIFVTAIEKILAFENKFSNILRHIRKLI